MRGSFAHLAYGAAIAALLGMLVGCGGDERTAPGEPGNGDELTYHKDIKPIIDRHCVACHTLGGIGPFVLEDYAGIYEMRTQVKRAVTERIMPPWLAADGCSDYQDDFSLSDAQIEAIGRWVDQGAKEGTPDEETAAPPTIKGLSRVDLTLQLPVRYTPTIRPDDYRCFVVDWPEDKIKYVTGFHVEPDNTALVHHVIAYLVSPKKRRQGAEEGRQRGGPGLHLLRRTRHGPGLQLDRRMGAWWRRADLPGGDRNQDRPGLQDRPAGPLQTPTEPAAATPKTIRAPSS